MKPHSCYLLDKKQKLIVFITYRTLKQLKTFHSKSHNSKTTESYIYIHTKFDSMRNSEKIQ